ncbi:MAG: CBS domain-containing protein [Methanosarcinaceae archaeon]
MQIKDIMVQPHTIDKSDTISHALDIMDKKSTRRLLVKHDGNLIGVLTMRNLTKELGTRKKGTKPASSLHVASAVSNNYIQVLSDTKVNDIITLIKKNNGVVMASENNDIVGWVTPNELMKSSHFGGYAAEIMQKDPITASPGDRVSHIRHLILDNNIGRLPVMESGKLVGIVTEKDVAKAMRAFRDVVSGNQQDSRIKNLIVEDIMTRGVKTTYTNTPVTDVVSMMIENNIGGVPVVNLEGDMVGFITRRSVINAIVE